MTKAESEMAGISDAGQRLAELGLKQISILMDTDGCKMPIINSLLPPGRNFRIDLIGFEYHSEEDRIELDRVFVRRVLPGLMPERPAHRIGHFGSLSSLVSGP